MSPAEPPNAAPKWDGSAAWTVIVVGLSLVAILVEAVTHLCAGMIFDPLPNAGYYLAYLLAALSPLLAQSVLYEARGGFLRRWFSEQRLLAVATALSLLSFLVAVTACFMLGPVLIFGAVGVLIGIGLIILAPVFLAFLSFGQFLRLRARWREMGYPKVPRLRAVVPALLLAGATLGWVVARPLAVGALIATATDAASSPEQQTRAVDGLRRLKGEDAVLARAYGSRLPYFEALGYEVMHGEASWQYYNWPGWDANWWQSDEKAREAKRLYFLITGRSFATGRVPWTVRHQRPAQWINDMAAQETGGTRVGRKVPDLSLASSEVEGVLDNETATAEYDWTLVFKNDNPRDPAEARAEILLPPGGVVHKVSLWINGEERPAAFGATAQVRKAYQEVAVVQRRDPLLVTMPAPGKVLAQCFPVPAGKTMQIRLGITAPLVGQDAWPTRTVFTPPAFGQINFEQPRSLRHRFTLRTPGPADGIWEAGQGWKVQSEGRAAVLEAALPPAGIFAPPRLMARETLPRVYRDRPQPLDAVVVVDTGAVMGRAFGGRERKALADALAKWPGGSRVRLHDARSADQATPPLDPVRDRGRILSWLAARRYVGGVDAVPALMTAIRTAGTDSLGGQRRGAVVYLHGPAPESVSDPTPLVEAMKARGEGAPLVLTLQAVTQAPDAIGERLASLPRARVRSVASFDGDLAATLEGAVPAVADPENILVPRLLHLYEGTERRGSQAGVRWSRIGAARRAVDAWYRHSNFGPEAWKASKAAANARLVTPLSGAVVLETQEQYEQHGLDDGTKKKSQKAAKNAAEGEESEPLPTVEEAGETTTAIPEPGTLILMVTAGGLTLAGTGLRRLRRRGRPGR